MKEAAEFIKKETGKGTPEGLKYALNKGTAYLNIYLAAEISQSYRLLDLSNDEIKFFSSLKYAADWIKTKTGGKGSYSGLHWSFKARTPILKGLK